MCINRYIRDDASEYSGSRASSAESRRSVASQSSVLSRANSEAKRRRSLTPRRNVVSGDSEHLRQRVNSLYCSERGHYSPRHTKNTPKNPLPFFKPVRSARVVAAHEAKMITDSDAVRTSEASSSNSGWIDYNRSHQTYPRTEAFPNPWSSSRSDTGDWQKGGSNYGVPTGLQHL